MQELLPFGEYVSPEQTQSAQNLFMGQFEAWELERILARLAVTGGPGLNMARRRGQPRTEPVSVHGELLGRKESPVLLPGRLWQPGTCTGWLSQICRAIALCCTDITCHIGLQIAALANPFKKLPVV